LEASAIIKAEENKVVFIREGKSPSKTDYVEGEKFSFEGMEIIATYEDGRERIVKNSDLEIIGAEVCYNEMAKHTVTLLYDNYISCDVVVNVEKSTVHDCQFGQWMIQEAATCMKPGKEVRACSICNEKEYREVPVVAHAEGEWIVEKPATETTAGKQYKQCIYLSDVALQQLNNYFDIGGMISGE
jgi:hypothetical protein